MKKLWLLLAFIISFNSASVTWATDETSLSHEREEQLLEIAKSNPKKALATMTNEELLQMLHDLNVLVQNLETNFATPIESKDGKNAYAIQEWSNISIPLMIALTVGGIVMRAKAFKNSPDNPAAYLVIAVIGVGVAATLASTSSMVVLLSPEEEILVRNKISHLRKYALSMEGSLRR